MCEYCETETELEDLGKKWLFDEEIDYDEGHITFGGVIAPRQKAISIDIVTTPVIYDEVLKKDIPIKYCPMCGRKL